MFTLFCMPNRGWRGKKRRKMLRRLVLPRWSSWTLRLIWTSIQETTGWAWYPNRNPFETITIIARRRRATRAAAAPGAPFALGDRQTASDTAFTALRSLTASATRSILATRFVPNACCSCSLSVYFRNSLTWFFVRTSFCFAFRCVSILTRLLFVLDRRHHRQFDEQLEARLDRFDQQQRQSEQSTEFGGRFAAGLVDANGPQRQVVLHRPQRTCDVLGGSPNRESQPDAQPERDSCHEQKTRRRFRTVAWRLGRKSSHRRKDFLHWS